MFHHKSCDLFISSKMKSCKLIRKIQKQQYFSATSDIRLFIYTPGFSFVPIYETGIAISVFSNQPLISPLKSLQINNAPSIRGVLLHYSKGYQQIQFSLEDIQFDTFISASLFSERYVWLMINRSGPFYSTQFFSQ